MKYTLNILQKHIDVLIDHRSSIALSAYGFLAGIKKDSQITVLGVYPIKKSYSDGAAYTTDIQREAETYFKKHNLKLLGSYCVEKKAYQKKIINYKTTRYGMRGLFHIDISNEKNIITPLHNIEFINVIEDLSDLSEPIDCIDELLPDVQKNDKSLLKSEGHTMCKVKKILNGKKVEYKKNNSQDNNSTFDVIL